MNTEDDSDPLGSWGRPFRICLGIVAVVSFLWVLGYQLDKDQPPASPAARRGGASTNPERPRWTPLPEARLVLLNFSPTYSFGHSLLTAEVTISNASPRIVKDFQIRVHHRARSGTDLGMSVRTIFDILMPGEVGTFSANFGFIHEQTAYSRAEIGFYDAIDDWRQPSRDKAEIQTNVESVARAEPPQTQVLMLTNYFTKEGSITYIAAGITNTLGRTIRDVHIVWSLVNSNGGKKGFEEDVIEQMGPRSYQLSLSPVRIDAFTKTELQAITYR